MVAWGCSGEEFGFETETSGCDNGDVVGLKWSLFNVR